MIIIRDSRPTDAAAIASVHVDSWRSAYAGLLPDKLLIDMCKKSQAARWARTVGAGGGSQTVLVADVPPVGVVGFGSCGPARSKRLRQAGEVYMLYVRPEHQDRGIGRKLLYRLFDSLVVRGMTSAVIWVLAENPSRFFYETMGGRCVAQRIGSQWDADLRETAYGWDDLAHVRHRSDARKAR